MLGSAAASMTLLPVANGMAQDAPAQTVPQAETFDTLTLELALLTKRKADERYIAGDTAEARIAYCDALAELLNNSPNLADPSKKAMLALLNRDIQYRLLLLDNGYAFWGATQSLKPSFPNLHLKRLKEYRQTYQALSQYITDRIDVTEQTGNRLTDLRTFVIQQKQELAKAASSNEVLAMQEAYLKTKQERLDQQIASLRQDRQKLETQLGAATAQAKAASSQLENIIAKAAMTSTGVDPSLFRAVENKRWDTLVVSIASSQLADSEQFQAAIADYSRSAGEIAGQLREAQELYETGQQTLDQAKAAAALLRDPSFESLTELGTLITDKMGENERKQWRQLVADAKPAMALVEMIDSTDKEALARKLRAEIEGYVAENGNLLRSDLEREARRHYEDLVDRVGRDALAEQARLIAAGRDIATAVGAQAADKRELLDLVVRSWPSAVLDQVNAQAVSVLVQAAGVADRAALTTRLKSEGINSLSGRLKIDAGNIVITNPAGTVAASITLTQVLDLPAVAKAEIDAATARQRLVDAVDKLGDTEGLRRALVKTLPTDQIEATLQQVMRPGENASAQAREAAQNNADALWDRLRSKLGGDFTRAVDGVVAAHAGSVYASAAAKRGEAEAKAEAASYPKLEEAPAPPGDPGPGGGGDVSQQVALAMLSYAYPGVGLAVQALTSFNNFNDAIDRAQRISAQLQRTLTDELQSIDAVSEMRLKREIAQNEIALARLAGESARAQLATLETAITANASIFNRNKGRIAARRALALYINEQMREQFDLLDRSITLWTGKGSIAERVVTDPRRIRLQLDQDIHLYDWLDRSKENSRADIDGLAVHWDQLIQLASDDCQAFGCDGGNVIGKIKETQFVPLENLLSAQDIVRLRQWRKARSNSALKLPLDINPVSVMVEPRLDERSGSRSDQMAFENLRVIEARAGMKMPGKYVQLSHIRLDHSGNGYVRKEGKLVRDTSLPAYEVSLAVPQPFDKKTLSERFLGPAASIKDFDGMALQSRWELTLEPFEENWNPLGPIHFRFALHFSGADPVDLERGLVGLAGITAGDPSIPADAVRYVMRWRSPPGSTVGNAAKAIRLKLQNQIEVPVGTVALAAAKPQPAQPCPGRQIELTPPAGAPVLPTAPSPLQLVRTCASDADLRRMLRRDAQAGADPREPATVARQRAKAVFAQLKAGFCKEQPISQRGPKA